MAVLVVKIRLHRIEGRHPVDPVDLAAALVEAISQDLPELEVPDREGDDAVYEVTLAQWLEDGREVEPAGDVEADGIWANRFCEWCGKPITDAPPGRARPRRYDTNACRQAAFRARHLQQPSPPGSPSPAR